VTAGASSRGHAFYQGDIADGGLIDRIFAEHPTSAPSSTARR